MGRVNQRVKSSCYYTVEEMADLFGIAEKTVYEWSHLGKLPKPIRKGHRWSRWPKAAVDEILRQDGASK